MSGLRRALGQQWRNGAFAAVDARARGKVASQEALEPGLVKFETAFGRPLLGQSACTFERKRVQPPDALERRLSRWRAALKCCSSSDGGALRCAGDVVAGGLEAL